MPSDDIEQLRKQADQALKRLDESERVVKAHRRNDLYGVLRLPRSASQHTIRKHYHKAALQHHPDHNHDDPFAEECFKIVSEVYATLSDPLKRREYDRTLPAREKPSQSQQQRTTRPPRSPQQPRPQRPAEPKRRTETPPPPRPAPEPETAQPTPNAYTLTLEYRSHMRRAIGYGIGIGAVIPASCFAPDYPPIPTYTASVIGGTIGFFIGRFVGKRRWRSAYQTRFSSSGS